MSGQLPKRLEIRFVKKDQLKTRMLDVLKAWITLFANFFDEGWWDISGVKVTA
jgi:hypothetical protein